MNLLKDKENLILCGYQNPSPHIQVIRVSDQSSYCLEKVVFPQEYWLFHAPIQSKLEIYTSILPKMMLADTIFCEKLQVQEAL